MYAKKYRKSIYQKCIHQGLPQTVHVPNSPSTSFLTFQYKIFDQLQKIEKIATFFYENKLNYTRLFLSVKLQFMKNKRLLIDNANLNEHASLSRSRRVTIIALFILGVN